ncbi:MAG: hypothetical protein LQ339_008194 [Xanthoria mediterranea]|nr:MAG: hypothetical protein LQ339_008194 [Xanthoria mediterranea]
MESHRATEGYTLPADFKMYKEYVDEELVEARRIIAEGMQERASLERQNALQRAAWLDELERARVAANRWTRPEEATVRKPKLISDQEIDADLYQAGFNGNTGAADEELPFAESEKHPPLYNNFPDQLRQMAVEMLLQRSKIAYILNDWNTMDISSRQAYNLATYFKWEPYLARSAFWIGIALYHRKKWTEAYEAFEEADKTHGYYISRRIILHWLRETSKRLEGSPWSTGLSAIRGENPPILTPLDTVVEEEDSFPFPATGEQHRVDKKGALLNNTTPAADQSSLATETVLLAYDPVPQRNTEPDNNGLGRRNAQSRVAAASPKDRTRVKPPPKAITLPSIVEPPRVRTPRLYEPQPSGGLRPAGNDELSSRAMGLSLAESSVPETSFHASRESEPASEEEGYPAGPADQTAYSEDIAGRSDQQPQSPTASPTLKATANHFNSQNDDDDNSPPSSYGTPDSPSHRAPAPNTLFPSSAPPLSPTSLDRQQRRSALLAHRRLEDAETDAAIRTLKAIASPRVASAKSLSSRSAEAMWPQPLGGGRSERVDFKPRRSKTVAGPATRGLYTALASSAGMTIRSRERRSLFDELEDQGVDGSGEGASPDVEEGGGPMFGEYVVE